MTETADSEQDDVIAFLSDPHTYGEGVATVEHYETHASNVFVAGQRAYKLKRAIRYPYLDYSTPERRRAMCEAELVVNRRLGSTLYLDVRPVTRNGEATLKIGHSGDSGAVDWLVVMRRFDQDKLLEQMRSHDRLTPVLIEKLARRLSVIHGNAEVNRRFGGWQAMRNVINENLQILRERAGKPFDTANIERLAVLSQSALAAQASLLDQRQQEGYVRRCHGDLHLNNIFMDGGEPQLFDAIEFSEEFGCIDVLYDLAFLLMDLERHGLQEYANLLLNTYLQESGDYRGLAVLPLFLSCRAAIRAHVTMAMANKAGTASGAHRYQARRLLDLAVSYLKPVRKRLVALGGLSGTGKSTLARELAPGLGQLPGAIILRSDKIRKKLYGVEEQTHLPQSAYEAAVTGKVYNQIASSAADVLEGGYSVIADAVYGSQSERALIAATAKKGNVVFMGIWLTAPLALLEKRVSTRTGDASDATIEVLRWQARQIEAPFEWAAIDASPPVQQVLSQLRRRIASF
jgi:hypothetical protein